MKGTLNNILQILSRVKDLLPLERKMREDRVVVLPGPVSSPKLPRIVRPGKPMPNISKMQIKLGVHDGLLLIFGLYKRYSPSIEFHAGRNGKANFYINYMFKRLRNQVKLGLFLEAQKTIGLLMRSHSYQICCFNYVAKGWYKNMRGAEVLKTIRQVKTLAKRKASNIDYKRVYLVEPSKTRPLGVPTLAGRVYLHMYNNLLTEGRMLSERGKQHAYLPGKGVITAWAALLDRIEKEPNIYEADFKGFFDNVNHKGLRSILEGHLRLPEDEVNLIERLNCSIIKLTKEDKIPEKERDIPFSVEGRLNPDVVLSKDDFKHRIGLSGKSRIPSKGYSFQGWHIRPKMSYEEFARGLMSNIIPHDANMRPLTKDDLEFYDSSAKYGKVDITAEDQGTGRELPSPIAEPLDWGLSKKIPTVQWEVKLVGVPQGAPTSCSLATLALRRLEKIYNIIFYADDVIFFPANADIDPISVLTDPAMGLKAHEGKSLWAKKEGKGLVEYIKFVGFKYYPASYTDTGVEAIGYPTLLILFLDILFFNIPLLSLVGTYIVLSKRYERHKPRFTAATRKGATLEFGNRESFLSYLNTARTLLLNQYYEAKLSGESLPSGVSNHMEQWSKLNSPVKIITESFIKKAESLHKAQAKASKLMDFAPVKEGVPHIKLTGGFMARMQANTGDISVKQDFRLRGSPKSWLDLNGVKYSFKHIIGKSSLNIFTASSFACDALLNASFKKVKRNKIRYVFISSRELKGQIRSLRNLMKVSKKSSPL